MTWLQHHTASEKLAADAWIAAQRGDVCRAQELYAQAAEAEELALAEVESGKSRTIGITAVSAVSLRRKSGQHQAAQALARHSPPGACRRSLWNSFAGCPTTRPELHDAEHKKGRRRKATALSLTLRLAGLIGADRLHRRSPAIVAQGLVAETAS